MVYCIALLKHRIQVYKRLYTQGSIIPFFLTKLLFYYDEKKSRIVYRIYVKC